MTVQPADLRLYPAFPLIGVSVSLFRDGKVLLIKRAKSPFLDHYSLPGGLVEIGESLEEAVRRELMEETALACGALTFNRHIEISERDPEGRVKRHYIVASFAGLWSEGQGQTTDEVSELLWTEPGSHIGALPTTPFLADVVENACRTLGYTFNNRI